jgi:UPF0716 protein FxsA
MPLLIVLLLWPLTEIALFVLVGGQVGVWGVLGLVALGVVAGVALLRLSGGQAIGGLRQSMAAGQDPAPALVGGALRAMAAGLLIAPGFLSDLIGILLLLPPVQAVIIDRIRGRIVAAGMQARQQEPRDTVIEGEFDDVTPGPRPTHRPSEWTRH